MESENKTITNIKPSCFLNNEGAMKQIFASTAEASGTPIPAGSIPTGVVISPNGKTGYATNQGSNTVSVVDIFSHTQTELLPVGNSPVGIDITSDGRFIVVSNSGTNTVSIINVHTGQTDTVTVGIVPLFLKILNGGFFI